ncbi:SsrA-binding protein SmpB [Pelagibacteraceae bacterium]|jgi:SsrA-binding protein|nr:SsrA-binding protein SmpB [Pelagibacteraceae bacterium]|tara:strand:- start:13252 stop:13725 length:474 start_codon:yes stop_codon:yes gene_type:complete
MKQKQVLGQKIICLNRKASFNYFLSEQIEAGIVLKGSEVKSLREGKGSIADSYAIDKNGELYLINSHIPSYRQSSYNNHNPKGERKLLLNRKELNKLIGKINQEGLTIVPTKMYFKKGKAKLELAVGKGKKLFDKRSVKKKRDWDREKARIFSRTKK